MALTDTLTTREALRRAVLDDIIARCELAAQTIEGGPLDGIAVVSMGVLRDQVTGSLMVELPTPSARYAEVITPATIAVSAVCPECDLPVVIGVKLGPKLTVDDDGAELSVKSSSKGMAHIHGQLTLPTEDGQLGLDDVVIDDLRLRILAAVAANVDAETEAVLIQWPTLDEIATALELASESDRDDLEESLYAYSQLETPLVDVVSVKGEPVRYALTPAGAAILAQAESGDDEDADDDGEDLGEPVPV